MLKLPYCYIFSLTPILKTVEGNSHKHINSGVQDDIMRDLFGGWRVVQGQIQLLALSQCSAVGGFHGGGVLNAVTVCAVPCFGVILNGDVHENIRRQRCAQQVCAVGATDARGREPQIASAFEFGFGEQSPLTRCFFADNNGGAFLLQHKRQRFRRATGGVVDEDNDGKILLQIERLMLGTKNLLRKIQALNGEQNILRRNQQARQRRRALQVVGVAKIPQVDNQPARIFRR